MAWLFFIDESGHDHRSTPYEVHGGFAVHASQLWPFVQGMQKLEIQCFGCRLHEYGKEIKGKALLGRDPFKFAGQQKFPLSRPSFVRFYAKLSCWSLRRTFFGTRMGQGFSCLAGIAGRAAWPSPGPRPAATVQVFLRQGEEGRPVLAGTSSHPTDKPASAWPRGYSNSWMITGPC